MKQYRCAIVGCGERGRMHALAHRHINRGQLVACCDRNIENVQKYSSEFDLNPYHDAAEMIIKERPDLVHLVTSPKSRVELMTLVDQLGVPACIVEKPIALEVNDWRQLTELEKISKTKFRVVSAQRFCIDAVRRKGKVAFVGECMQDLNIKVSPDMIRKGLTLIGAWHYNISLFPKIMQVIQQSPSVRHLISHVFPLSDIQKAFEVSASNQCAKIILKPWK